MAKWNFIVVGGGSAGALVAARLTEDPACEVLLIEAGPDYRAQDTPKEFKDRTKGLGLALEAPKNHLNPEFYWHGITATRAQGQEPFQYRRGRGLGGSSIINGLYAIRGVPDDFSEWEKLGADGWGPDAMLAAYGRIEDEHDFPGMPFHGTGGPTPVYREPEAGWGGVDRALKEAALDAGYGWSPDHNDPASTGVSPMAMNIRGGDRVSTNHAYIEPARGRANLTILGDTLIDRVLFEGTLAVGVVDAAGSEHRVAEGGEVILSAGSSASPALLMRSGIGPAEELAELGIELLVDLPVGRSAQDHAVVFVELPVDPAAQTCVGNRPTNIVVRYSSGFPGGRTNDMMILATNHNYWFGKETAGLAVSLEQPLSRGRMRLRSADPADEPHFDLDFLSNPRDLARVRDGLQRARTFLEHPAFQQIATGEPTWPQDDAEIMATVKDTMHLCCTARMGHPEDPETVVDPKCNVVGVTNLRVVDASIMPTVVSANTYLTVLALAEVFFDKNPELLAGSRDAAVSAGDA
ncbi:GMC family oxidoreductase [Arthrobacter sulfonylureivorans]|uniref:GMC family oxidoreductase N-terminal domain-containing protein n=1 Tax=Arthrobacter sulfonylureivorans TaxID=2486855 RepID=A0ABY3W5Z2_9MICC|nr:GMC oxidoreductase [Arthrobacter sulfonylureivorans]UNK45655.1 GMC family oxidoreductase N-terminal domain-containing protein [Arthrobacter sulfonylureivorans]